MSDNIPGLPKKNKKCKICNCFSDEHLAEITSILIQGSMTYREVIERYTPLMRPNSDFNDKLYPSHCSNHLKHSNPTSLVKHMMSKTGTSPEKSAVKNLEHLLANMYGAELDKQDAVSIIYTERIKNLSEVQNILAIRKMKWDNESEGPTKIKFERDLVTLTERMEKLWKSLNTDLLQHLRIEKPDAPSQVVFIQNFYSTMEGFIDEVIQILRSNLDDDVGVLQNIVRQVGGALDRRVQTLTEREIIQGVDYEVVKDGS